MTYVALYGSIDTLQIHVFRNASFDQTGTPRGDEDPVRYFGLEYARALSVFLRMLSSGEADMGTIGSVARTLLGIPTD